MLQHCHLKHRCGSDGTGPPGSPTSVGSMHPICSYSSFQASRSQDMCHICLGARTPCRGLRSCMEMRDRYHHLLGNVPSEQVCLPPPSLSLPSHAHGSGTPRIPWLCLSSAGPKRRRRISKAIVSDVLLSHKTWTVWDGKQASPLHRKELAAGIRFPFEALENLNQTKFALFPQREQES